MSWGGWDSKTLAIGGFDGHNIKRLCSQTVIDAGVESGDRYEKYRYVFLKFVKLHSIFSFVVTFYQEIENWEKKRSWGSPVSNI